MRKTLAGRYYTSPEIYRAESERIFRRHWLCVGRVAEVERPGQFVLRNVDGDNIVVLRDHDGELRGFHNVCRHRGSRVCIETQGTVGRSIRCPYHGWTYSTSGDLLAAANTSEGFNAADHSLSVGKAKLQPSDS